MRVNTVADLRTLVGRRVRTRVSWAGVPEGTQGVVDEFYTNGDNVGITVAWDFPDKPLPPGYKKYDGRPVIATGILRDGFGRGAGLNEYDETEHLELI